MVLILELDPNLRLYRLSDYSHTVFNDPSITHKDANFAPKKCTKIG